MSDNSADEQNLIAGFAYLLLIATNMSVMLLYYTGLDEGGDLFNQATNFLLTPKPVTKKPFVNFTEHVRIGNHTFLCPTNKVWIQARTVAAAFADIIIHITMEQRV